MHSQYPDDDNYVSCMQWPTPEVFYDFALHNSLYAHPESSIRFMLQYAGKQFSFDENHFWFCLTGISKAIYNGVFGLTVGQYMTIYNLLKEKIEAIFFAQNWNCDVFLAWKSDEKQIAILMSPRPDARCTARELADIIDRLVQQTYEQKIFHGNTRFRNATSLCGPASGYKAIRESYHTVRALNDLSFFHMDGRLLTEDSIAQTKNDIDYAAILDLCFELRGYIDKGDCKQTQRLFCRLFLDTIRNTCDLSRCDDALSFLKSILQIRCAVYSVSLPSSLDELCSRKSYYKIEECVDALLPLLQDLCTTVRNHGSYSKPVLNALYYIHIHFASYLVLSDIARYSNTNATYLSNKFKEETGYSMRNYINKIRLETAQQALLQSSDTIAAVANRVGFEDVRYFTRVFKQRFGCTPTEYRQQNHA